MPSCPARKCTILFHCFEKDQFCSAVLLPLSCTRRSLDLGHLTALTRLDLTSSPLVGKEGWRDIKAQDKLPPNLKRFSACNCLSAAPLLALTSLEALSIGPQCHMPAAELQRLRAMTHLSHVELAYTRSRDSTGMPLGSGWGAIAVVRAPGE
jgi:hypothetical protein